MKCSPNASRSCSIWRRASSKTWSTISWVLSLQLLWSYWIKARLSPVQTCKNTSQCRWVENFSKISRLRLTWTSPSSTQWQWATSNLTSCRRSTNESRRPMCSQNVTSAKSEACLSLSTDRSCAWQVKKNQNHTGHSEIAPYKLVKKSNDINEDKKSLL